VAQDDDPPAPDPPVPQNEPEGPSARDVPRREPEPHRGMAGPRHALKTRDGTDRRSATRLGGRSPRGRRHEDTMLSALLKGWVESTWPGDEIKSSFIETVLEAKLGSYRKQARSWRAAQILIWLLIALLGLLVSVFAGFKSGHGFTIVAGALVATLTTLTNATHPAKEADGYLAARLALRDEGWYLLNRTGDYKNLSEDERYQQFTDAVHRIVQTKRTSTTLDALTP
jgi:hypothetical protein